MTTSGDFVAPMLGLSEDCVDAPSCDRGGYTAAQNGRR